MNIILQKPVAKELVPDLFADITELEYEVVNTSNETVLVFYGDLTPEETRLVKWRTTLIDRHEDTMRAAAAATEVLNNFRNNPAAVTNAEVVAHVKYMDNVLVRLIEVVTEQMD